MAFAFTRRSNVQAQVRRIAIEQIESALAESHSDADFDKMVHGLRRRCKKLRGLLRLIEPRFAGFKTENQAVRAAAAGLSGTRDAAVMKATFSALLEFDGAEKRAGRIEKGLADAVSVMLDLGAASPAEDAGPEQLLADFRTIMGQAGKRAKAWSIGEHGFAALGPGLELTYTRMAKGLKTARSDGDAVAMHDWRKHTKYHWHHVSLLRHAAPDMLHGQIEALDQLGELLGDHHNLHVLGEHLRARSDAFEAGEVEAIEEAIVANQADLAGRAFALGQQLTAEKPGVLRRRFDHYWHLLPEKA